MEPPVLILWYFKLLFVPKQLFGCHTSTDNPEFSNGRVNTRF